MIGHKLIGVRSQSGESWDYAVCAECFRASGQIEEEMVEKIQPLAENFFAAKNMPERTCHYCGIEIVTHEPDYTPEKW